LHLLEVQGLTVHYGKAQALEGVDLHVAAGELVGVLGPNGAGKSTLLKAISGAQPWAGEIRLRGESLQGVPTHVVVGRGICHCPEGRRLFPELTVSKNLELGAYLRRDRAGIEVDLRRVFELFPVLSQRLGNPASTLSGGQQQMLAIGRALMGRPSLLLLDEPSVGIAHRLKIEIFDAIRAIASAGTAVLIAEQDAQNTMRVARRVYVLENGRVATTGESAALAHDDGIRRAYLGL
jgi:branched-chain amino acid transport system ATP-binding protein